MTLNETQIKRARLSECGPPFGRKRQSRGSDLDKQRACVRTRGWGLDRQCMYLAREGERERERGRECSAWGAMAGV